MKKILGIVFGVLASLLILTAGCYLYWCKTLENDIIWDDVTINNVSVQGMTKAAAAEAVQQKFTEDYEDSAFVIHIAEEAYTVNVFPLLEMNADHLIEEAYKTGHGKWYIRGLEKYQLQYAVGISHEVLPDLKDLSKLSDMLEETGIQKVDTVVESECELKETSLVVHKGSTGVAADMDSLEKEILQKLENNEFSGEIECPVHVQEPEDVDLESYYDQIYKYAVNAVFYNGFEILQSQTGVSFDLQEAEERVESAEEGTDVVIDFVYTEPEISTEELKELLFRDMLGSYTTKAGGTAARLTNVGLAANACKEVILLPGEEFSYNKTVGERTAERGYQTATVYANGQSVPGIGGGICQVSSTIFAAALQSGMHITERQNHSMSVSYLPLGMDATVSWGLLDFKYRNDTDYPVKMTVSFDNNEICVEFYGTKEDSNTIEVQTQYLSSNSVKTIRVHYTEDGELIKTEEICTSTYK